MMSSCCGCVLSQLYAIPDATKTDVTPATLSRNSVTQLYRWTKSQTSATLRVAQLLTVAQLPNKAALYSVQLCRKNAVNDDLSILVYATKLQCATCTVAYCNFVA